MLSQSYYHILYLYIEWKLYVARYYHIIWCHALARLANGICISIRNAFLPSFSHSMLWRHCSSSLIFSSFNRSLAFGTWMHGTEHSVALHQPQFKLLCISRFLFFFACVCVLLRCSYHHCRFCCGLTPASPVLLPPTFCRFSFSTHFQSVAIINLYCIYFALWGPNDTICSLPFIRFAPGIT